MGGRLPRLDDLIRWVAARALRPLLAALLLLCACGPAPLPSAVRAPPVSHPLPEEGAFLRQVDRTRGFRDCFDVIRDPALVPAAQAPRMADTELVLGLDLGAVRVAYPVNYLNLHEIVEHDLAGLHLLACW